MSSKAKVTLHFIVSIGANLLMLDVLPAEWKGWAILAFNVVQVLYAYFDPTYALVKMGHAK